MSRQVNSRTTDEDRQNKVRTAKYYWVAEATDRHPRANAGSLTRAGREQFKPIARPEDSHRTVEIASGRSAGLVYLEVAKEHNY